MTNVGGGTSWSVTLPTTTGPFDTGPTNFTVVATTSTTSGTGSTSVQLTIGASTSTVTVKATPSQTLSATGTLSNAISVTATGSSAITSGSVTYATHAGSATRFLAGSGNNWSVTLPADATVYDPGTESFSVAVVFSDGSTGTGLASISLFSSSLPPDVTALIANSPFTAGGTTQGFCVDNTSFNLFTATTVDATVSNVATTDTVRLTAPGLTTAEFVMSYLKTNADGSMVFRYSVPSGTPFPNATSIVLKAYALKTISGTQYRDDFVTSPGIPIQAFKKSSSCL
jgi:hypothetical protein